MRPKFVLVTVVFGLLNSALFKKSKNSEPELQFQPLLDIEYTVGAEIDVEGSRAASGCSVRSSRRCCLPEP